MGSGSGFECTFWGVRGSTPCANRQHMAYGGNTTCVQVHIPGSEELLILDSGTGIRNLGQKLVRQNRGIGGRIFITHPHWDHIQGFPFFQPIYHSENHFDIHMPVQETGGCREILSGHLSKTFFPVSLDMLDANLGFYDQPQERREYGSYDVEFILANHSINTAIYKLHLDGKTLVFAPDNELIPRKFAGGGDRMEPIRQFIAGADLLIHDAQYDLASYRQRQGWGHSPWQEVVATARKAKVKKLILTHHDPDSDDKKLEQRDGELQQKYGSDFETIRLASEGQTLAI